MSTLWLCLDDKDVTTQKVAEVRALVPDMTVLVARELEPAALPDVEIVAGRVSPAQILRAPNVRWVQHWAAGVDGFTQHPEIVARGFRLTNTSGIHSIPISEHILAFLLALGRGLTCALQQQANHVWYAPENPCRDDIFELSGKTMVLVGVGAIGSRTAAIAAAFGVHVIGVRHDPSQAVPGVAEMVGPSQLLEVLPRADFVVLTVPLTDATRGMIGETELRAMKPSAIIVNIGRGETIQQDALIRALQEGWINGAGLDVFEEEPLPTNSPLWEMPNVILTSHYAGHTPHYNDRAFAVFIDNLRRYLADRPLCNVVDMAAGY